MKELFTALTLAQAEMENASKDKNNPFFKSKYADLNSVMGAIKPALAKHGLAFVQVCHDAENAAKVETIIVHADGQQFSAGCVSVPVSKADAQGYGSALTYARRYSLAAAFGVGAEDDDGNAAAKAAPKFTGKVTPTAGVFEGLSPEVQNRITDLATVITDYAQSGAVDDAIITIDEAALEADEMVALKSRLDSKVRTAIQKELARRKEATVNQAA
jgi:hypothetical protein